MMDAPKEKRFLPALALELAQWFPELNGRALAVSEIEVTKENVPTLPLAMVAFARSAADPPVRSSTEEFEVTDHFVVEFWLEPMRIKQKGGGETPFWSYYDYEAIRDTLLANIVRWPSPNNGTIQYRSLTVDADRMAITLTFAFTVIFQWCAPVTDFGEKFKAGVRLCTPVACVPEAICPDPDPCDPCP